MTNWNPRQLAPEEIEVNECRFERPIHKVTIEEVSNGFIVTFTKGSFGSAEKRVAHNIGAALERARELLTKDTEVTNGNT